MSKIDIDKFVASLIEFSPQQSMKYIKALADQDLEYKDGEIVEISQESEEEKIRKVLIDYFKRYKEQEECGVKTFYGISTNDILSWLEKQGEPFDDNIITRDDEILQAISIGLTDAEKDLGWSDFGGLPIEEIQDWLEKQEKSKWTEEDEDNLNMAIYFMRNENTPYSPTDVEPVVEWLCGLKQRMDKK